MRKWKQLKKTIRLKSMLNLELDRKEASALVHRNLKVKDGVILATTQTERGVRDFVKTLKGG